MQTTAKVKCLRKSEIARGDSTVIEVMFTFTGGALFTGGAPDGSVFVTMPPAATTGMPFNVGRTYTLTLTEEE